MSNIVPDEPQYFTLASATTTLPLIRNAFTRILQLRPQVQELVSYLERTPFMPDDPQVIDISPAGASPEIVAMLASLKVLIAEIDRQIDLIKATGCVIKDIGEGIIDWPTLINGRAAYYCWHYGEATIGYWHEVKAGFSGRQPLPVAELV